MEEIKSRNKHYFQKFYQIFEEVEKKLNIEFRILDIGFRNKFSIRKRKFRCNKKYIAWVVNKDYLNDMDFINFRKRKDVETNIVILER